MKIGYLEDRYPERRFIIEKTDGQYIKLSRWLDVNYVASRLLAKPRKLLNKIFNRGRNVELNNAYFYRPLVAQHVDIIHTINHVCQVPNNQKWCTTFETRIPRTDLVFRGTWIQNNERIVLDSFTRKELELLLKDNCVGILAMSNCAYNNMLYFLSRCDLPKDQTDKLVRKMQVTHPPQKVCISEEEMAQKFDDVEKKVKFIFVGSDFFRKGGTELIRALDFYADKYDFELTLISSFGYDDYCTRTSKEVREKWIDIVQSREWIHWIPSLPNAQVLEACRKAHIGLLPSYADSYGFSVLEQQACGCPVITSNVRALPEINPNSCGWVVNITKNIHTGEAIYKPYDELAKRKNEMYLGLLDTLGHIFENRYEIREKGYNSLKRIKEQHDYEKYGEKLLNIYNI